MSRRSRFVQRLAAEIKSAEIKTCQNLEKPQNLEPAEKTTNTVFHKRMRAYNMNGVKAALCLSLVYRYVANTVI
jgi:hypothetical protein